MTNLNRFRAKVGKWLLACCYVPMRNKKRQVMHYHKDGSYQYVYRNKRGLHIGRRYYKAGQPRLRHVKSMAEFAKCYEKPISKAAESISYHILNKGPHSSDSSLDSSPAKAQSNSGSDASSGSSVSANNSSNLSELSSNADSSYNMDSSNDGFVMKSDESSQPSSSSSSVVNDGYDEATSSSSSSNDENDNAIRYIPQHSDDWYKQCLFLSNGNYSVTLNDGNTNHYKYIGKDKLEAMKFADNNVPRWLDENSKDNEDTPF